MSRDCQVCINLPALQHNVQVIKQRAPNSRCVAVIKADGYGHGMLTIAKALSEILHADEMLAVATIDEALELRANAIQHSILVLEGFHSPAELQHCVTERLTSVLHAPHQLALLEQAKKMPANVWLKINTGMNRLGLAPETIGTAARFLHNQQIDFTWMSHFANADKLGDPLTAQQLKVFDQCIANTGASESHHHNHLQRHKESLANSAAVFALPEAHRDWIRPGIALYGISPFTDKTGADLGLQPVMQLQTEVIAIQHCKAGDSVGYCSRYTCQSDTHIGVLAIGYGDGYPRQAQDGTPVSINGKTYPLAGMPSMDMLTVDLGQSLQVKVGDMAQLWGELIPVETVAQMADTIPYELTCRILPRVDRVIRRNPQTSSSLTG